MSTGNRGEGSGLCDNRGSKRVTTEAPKLTSVCHLKGITLTQTLECDKVSTPSALTG